MNERAPVERHGQRASGSFGPFGAIDALRGLSIVAVMLTHIELLAPLPQDASGGGLPLWLFRLLFRSGYYGVNVFFVISGFLITCVAIGRWGDLSALQPRRFWQLRVARIVPSLLLLIVLLIALHAVDAPTFAIDPAQTSLPHLMLSVVTLSVNWLDANRTIPDAWGVLWSLCIEEMFYLAFPLITFAARQRVLMLAILAAFVIVGPFARISPTSNDLWHGHGYFSCFGEIATGVLAAWFVQTHPLSARTARLAAALGLAGIAFVMCMRSAPAFLWLKSAGLQINVLAFGTAALLASVTSGRPNAAQGGHALAPMRWLGRSSYEIYLFHMIALGLVFPHLPRAESSGALACEYVVAVVLCGLTGHLIHRFFSEPAHIFLRKAGRRPDTHERFAGARVVAGPNEFKRIPHD